MESIVDERTDTTGGEQQEQEEMGKGRAEGTGRSWGTSMIWRYRE